MEYLLNLCGLENSKPTVNPGRRSTVMELASAIFIGRSRLLHSHSGRYDISKARTTNCLRLEPHMTVQKGMIQLLRSGWRFGNAPKRYAISLQCTRCDDVQLMPETDRNQSQLLRCRVLPSQCLRRRTSGSRRTLQKTSLQRFSSSRKGFRGTNTTMD